MEYSWDDVRVFLAVARRDTLSAAGRVLKIDPATVGRRIARLEEAIGSPLFVKSPNGYALTEAGTRLMAHSERVEQAIIGLNEDISGTAGSLSGQIRIGAPDGCANFLLPQVCARIADQNPDLDIQIVALPRVVNLSKREADMAIAVSPPSTGRLSVQKVTEYHLHLAASDSYLERHGPISSLSDLSRHRMVGYIADMIFDKELDYLSELGRDHVNLASNSVAVQFNWLRAGAGVGIVHDFALPFAPSISRVLADQFQLKRSFYLIRHVDDRRLERMNRFAQALSHELKKEVEYLESFA
ncbi:MAG: LysR family transcriptional regulator [Rhodobacteraceae bacterium]|nr:LysR family transcriptional regulator [Paracoccaceae bacterium]